VTVEMIDILYMAYYASIITYLAPIFSLSLACESFLISFFLANTW